MDPLSVIASTIAIIQAISSTYDTIQSIRNLPDEFDEVARFLPLVSSTLKVAQLRIQRDRLDRGAADAVGPVIKDCENKAIALRDIFEEINKGIRAGKNGSAISFYRAAVLRYGKAGRVESLMQSILNGLQALATHQVFQASGQIQVTELQEAVNVLAAVPSSVPDLVFDNSGSVEQHIHQGGTGNQFVNKGHTKNVNFGPSFESSGGPIYYDAGYHGSEARRNVLQALYVLPYADRKNRNPDRAPGTCEWFVSHRRFQEWNENPSSSILWVSADPGSGKSVLAKHLVDKVLQNPSRTICYFFFKDDFDDQKSVRYALCCLLHRLFVQKENLLSEKILKRAEAHQPKLADSFEELWNTLLTAAMTQDAGEIVCVLDAFDECQSQDQITLSRVLEKFYGSQNSQSNLKFLITSRPYVSIKCLFQPLELVKLPIIRLSGEDEDEMKQISQEIDVFVRFRVKSIGQRLGFRPEDEALLLESLNRNTNRTYLWVYLVLQLIEDGIVTETDGILKVTNELPLDVDQAYDKILCKSQDPNEAKKLLHIVVAAARPLTLTEMAFALAIRETHHASEDVPLAPKKKFYDRIRQLCGLFVVVVDTKIYLLHQTAREFLVENTPPETQTSCANQLKWKASLQPKESHRILRQICIWNLLFTNLNPSFYRGYSEGTTNEVFVCYSAAHWAIHFRASGIEDSQSTQQAYDICNAGTKSDYTWFDIYLKNVRPDLSSGLRFTTFQLASFLGIEPVVRLLLETKGIDVNATDEVYQRTALFWATDSGSEEVVKLLIRDRNSHWKRIVKLRFRRGVKIDTRDKEEQTPLSIAVLRGHETIAEWLVDAGAKVDAIDRIGGSPVSYAISTGQDDLASRLLKGAPADPADAITQELLISAVRRGKLDFIRILLDKGADRETKDKDGNTVLILAFNIGKNDVVRLLLDKGADTEARDGAGHTPLSSASRSGQNGVVELLLDKGADIEAIYGARSTPLALASRYGHSDIVKLLLDKGANIEARDTSGRTPLSSASRSGQNGVVELLLDKGANIEARDTSGRTPLSSASRSGQNGVVKLLLDKGANIEARDTSGRTPLSSASRSGQNGVVELLLDKGADIEARDTGGRTPLALACRYAHSYIVKLLQAQMTKSNTGTTPVGFALN